MTTETKIVHVCGRCGFTTSAKTTIDDNFYISYSPYFKHWGRAPLCKICSIKLSLDSEGNLNLKNLLNVLYRLDKPYLTTVLDSAKEKKTGATIVKHYMRVIVMPQYVGYTFIDGDLNIDKILENQVDRIENPNKAVVIDEDYESVEMAYLVNKWGKELSVQDLQWLEEKYNDWENGYEIEGKTRDLLVKQLCFEELFVYKERPRGGDVSKRLTSITKLMGQGNFLPKQQSASEESEFSTLAEFIVKVEKVEPCFTENHELKDVDGMRNKLKAMAGAVNRTTGNSDQYTDIFDEIFEEHTMDLSNVDDEVGSD